jgi:hypothetical protein
MLKVPQAMRAAGFTDEDSQSTAKQMNVRRAMAVAAMEKIPSDTLPVTVPSRSSPTATSSVSTLSMVMVVLPEGVEEINPNPPVLEQVRLTVSASIMVVRNKKKVKQWKSAAMKAATLMYHKEQQMKAGVDENCVKNCMSADKVEAVIKQRFEGTGPLG